jgi:predicted enzyme related to lactoylglutathione lyase
MPGDLVYFVIPAADAGRAQAFYGDLFGWSFSTGNVPGGFNIEGSSPPGGIFGGGEGSRPHPYFDVDDIQAAAAQVRELGGEASDPEEIPSGWMSHCKDDQGVEFGLWQGR